MELNPDKPGVAWQLEDFDEPAVGRQSREGSSQGCELIPVGVVEFVPVAVALMYQVGIIYLGDERVLLKLAGVAPQPHGASQTLDVLLIGHQVDDLVGD
jgi:hypothetical protein